MTSIKSFSVNRVSKENVSLTRWTRSWCKREKLINFH